MRFVDSRCIHCGATLKVAQDATHLCCQYCKAELLVVRDGAEITTQMLAVIQMPPGKPMRLPADWAVRFAHLQPPRPARGPSVSPGS